VSLLTDIAGLVDDALEAADILTDITYTPPSTGGTMVAGAWSGATAGTPAGCRGWVDEDVARLLPDPAARKANHRLVGITQPSLAVTPAVQGKLLVRGTTHTVLRVSQDPAAATWLLLTEV
jgi:hypothetical protein